MSARILICGVNFDQRPEGICTGRLVRALVEHGAQVTMVCARQKSTLGYSHPNLQLLALGSGLRHPRWAWDALARMRGEPACLHYPWARKVAALQPDPLPDVIYARAWPHSSLVAGYLLARRLQRPLWLHFSDPFPPPPKEREAPALMAGLAQMALAAQGATFTNAQAATYQLRHLPPRPPGWAQVLGHVAPPAQTFGPAEDAQRFVYIGSFHPSRPADLLLEGYALHARSHAQARLHFVGTRAEQVEPLARRLGIASRIAVEPYTQDVPGWQRRAAVLVAVDWMQGEPVYLLTKVIESLVVNRPLLLLTQPGSPGAELAQRCPQSVVCITSRDPAAIAEGFARAAAMALARPDYTERRAVMDTFAARNIAARCVSLLLGASPLP